MTIKIVSRGTVLHTQQIEPHNLTRLIDYAKSLFWETAIYSVDDVMSLAAKHCEVTIEDLKQQTKSRLPELVKARAFVMCYLYREVGYSLSEAGKVFGKDHATVLHAIRNVDNYWKLGYEKRFGKIVNKNC